MRSRILLLLFFYTATVVGSFGLLFTVVVSGDDRPAGPEPEVMSATKAIQGSLAILSGEDVSTELVDRYVTAYVGSASSQDKSIQAEIEKVQRGTSEQKAAWVREQQLKGVFNVVTNYEAQQAGRDALQKRSDANRKELGFLLKGE